MGVTLSPSPYRPVHGLVQNPSTASIFRLRCRWRGTWTPNPRSWRNFSNSSLAPITAKRMTAGFDDEYDANMKKRLRTVDDHGSKPLWSWTRTVVGTSLARFTTEIG